MALRLRDNADRLAEAASKLSGVLGDSLLQEALRVALEALQAEVQRSAKQHLAKDPTGALVRSWRVFTESVGEGIARGSVGSDLPYARIHDVGGTIRPKRAKYLAIPLRPPVPRGLRGLSPRFDSTPMRAWRSKKGNLLLWQVGRGPARPRYLLRESVEIKATHYARLASESAARDVEQAFITHIDAALKRAEGSP